MKPTHQEFPHRNFQEEVDFLSQIFPSMDIMRSRHHIPFYGSTFPSENCSKMYFTNLNRYFFVLLFTRAWSSTAILALYWLHSVMMQQIQRLELMGLLSVMLQLLPCVSWRVNNIFVCVSYRWCSLLYGTLELWLLVRVTQLCYYVY